MRACPLCEANKNNVVIGVDAYDIAKCAACGFVYVRNPREEDVVVKIGKNSPCAPLLRTRHKQIKRYIDRICKAKSAISVAEIGTGFGGLASLFGLDNRYKYYGYEPNVDRAAFCRLYNINVVNEFYRPGVSRYDYIILDNVLEHVYEPKRLLRWITEDLVPGGTAIIIVPNLHDIRRLLPAWRKKNYWRPICHVNYFTKKSLFRALHEVGLTPKMIGFAGLDIKDGLPYFMKAMLDKLGIPLFGLSVVGRKG